MTPPRLEQIVVPVPGTNHKRTIYRQRVGILPGQCEGYLAYPDAESPPGMIPVTDEGGSVYWLAPGNSGDHMRIGTDGIPFWSPI